MDEQLVPFPFISCSSTTSAKRPHDRRFSFDFFMRRRASGLSFSHAFNGFATEQPLTDDEKKTGSRRMNAYACEQCAVYFSLRGAHNISFLYRAHGTVAPVIFSSDTSSFFFVLIGSVERKNRQMCCRDWLTSHHIHFLCPALAPRNSFYNLFPRAGHEIECGGEG